MSTTSKRGRGLFFSSTKSFAISLGWDFETIETDKLTDSRWQFLQLVDAICSKRVDTPLFRSLMIEHAEKLDLIVETHTMVELGLTFYRISSDAEIDKISVVAKATGFDRSFVESWNESQIDIAFSNLGKSDAKKGVLWIVGNGTHILSRPTVASETLGDIKTTYREEYLD